MDNGFTRSTTKISEEVAKDITRTDELSYELKIADVMTPNPRTISPDALMEEVVEMFRTQRISGAPVTVHEKLVGIISIEDVIHCLLNGALEKTAREYMTSSVVTVNAHDPVIKALEKFTHTYHGRLPVTNSAGKLVGILTKGDITRGLLKALNSSIQEEEVRRYRASHLFEDILSDRTSLILRYYIKPRDFTNGGAASSYIKRALLRLGANTQLARRIGIAVYEAEMNLIIHTNDGGYIRVEIEPHRITIRAIDDGPGIDDIQMALKPGYSTATEAVREMGFGAGMGLVNIQRCVDKMTLESTPGKGTRLEMRIYLDKQPDESETNG
jgi:CBS domain-containing protein/anti-sigma regulatory factor (Ser/Thr protein kinase)